MQFFGVYPHLVSKGTLVDHFYINQKSFIFHQPGVRPGYLYYKPNGFTPIVTIYSEPHEVEPRAGQAALRNLLDYVFVAYLAEYRYLTRFTCVAISELLPS